MSRVAVARPAITAARNSAAVSTRRIRGPSVRRPPAGGDCSGNFLVRESPLRPDGETNVTAGNRVSCRLAATIVPAEVARISGNALTKRHQTICDLPNVLASARMRQEAIRACSGAGDEIGPGLRLLDLQEAVAAALLRRLDHRPPQTHNRLLDRLGHAARSVRSGTIRVTPNSTAFRQAIAADPPWATLRRASVEAAVLDRRAGGKRQTVPPLPFPPAGQQPENSSPRPSNNVTLVPAVARMTWIR